MEMLTVDKQEVRICLEYATNHGLHVVKIIREEKSAKKSAQENPKLRPQFMEMLKGFPTQYDGLLSYHPDRVARNMRDAGVIILLSICLIQTRP